MASTVGPNRTPACLRVAGAWAGLVEVLLDEWAVKDLREEVSRRSGFPVQSINLISAGKILKDQQQPQEGETSSPTLRAAGLGENSKILVTRVGGEQANLVNQASERSDRLVRIKAAADAMAKRSNEDGFPTDDFDIQLANQSGDELLVKSEDDRRALVMGLMLHAKARNLLQDAHFAEALEVLSMSEESFSLCDRKLLEGVDNVALLQLDTVWCLFMLRDIARLAVARERLSKAREGLRRSHGRDLERLRILQGGFCPELAVYVRLELLEGVVAYHSGQSEAAKRSLLSAKNNLTSLRNLKAFRFVYQRVLERQLMDFKLQVSDDDVAQLASLGFTAVESRRALRVSGQDVQRAVEFTMDEKQKKVEQTEEDRKRRRERREQRKFGKTLAGKAVDIFKLNKLALIGYDRRVAAEALRQSENDIQLALDVLSNPASFTALQVALEASSSRSHPREVDDTALTTLLSMGFDSERATRALRSCESSNEAIDRLLQGEFVGRNSSPTGSDLAAGLESSAPSSQAPSTADSSEFGDDEDDSPVGVRDEEMEEDIASSLTGDPFAEYDLDVDREGEAISEYLDLVDSHGPR